jgi:hypothetical protein
LITFDVAAKDAGPGVDAEMESSPTAEGAFSAYPHQMSTTCLICFVRNVIYRLRWKDDVRETYGENFNSWTKRVASRTLEGLEGYDAATQVKGDE